MNNTKITYFDKSGTINSERINLDAPFIVRLDSSDFLFDIENLTPLNRDDKINSRFELDTFGNLTNYELETQIPIKLVIDNQLIDTHLHYRLMNSKCNSGGSNLNGELCLKINNEEYQTNTFDLFESGIQTLNTILPSNIKLICCFNCKFSDYSPSGQGLYGMHCFIGVKEFYLKAKDKDDIFNIIEHSDNVGETGICEKFEPRVKDT